MSGKIELQLIAFQPGVIYMNTTYHLVTCIDFIRQSRKKLVGSSNLHTLNMVSYVATVSVSLKF